MNQYRADDSRHVKRGAVVLMEGYSEVIREVVASTDSAQPTVVLRLANGLSPSFRPGDLVTLVPA